MKRTLLENIPIQLISACQTNLLRVQTIVLKLYMFVSFPILIPSGSGLGDLPITSSDGLVGKFYFSARNFISDFSTLSIKLWHFCFLSKLIVKRNEFWGSAEVTV